MTPQDPTLGAWNTDTGAISHLNTSVTSLSENFNTCMYPSISVGDGHSIPVTNTGHSILPTPLKSLHLNNVLITPHVCGFFVTMANGSTQLEWVDVDETFSPVVKPGTIQTVLSLPAFRHWLIHQLDVKNAFYMVSLWA
ncbi:ribonuclease H-like domain-containing protein [Tanacetum coccineum]